ncbi:MAG: PAS domain S-box protein [Candidatus Accumulibacter necessarius]|jgi:nitrogen fixation negative regulator NifL|uniref:PAS domain S-box protein n=1 Tax=Candidatus Accumulibacter necessarius TaxID=2954386 RepID=UPI002FC2B731
MANEQLKLAADGEATGLSPSIHPQVFQHTVNQADMAISITDVQGNILYVNPAFTRVTGYTSDEAVGQNQSILSNRTMPREFYQALWQTHFARRALERAPDQPAQGRQQVPRRAEHLAGGQRASGEVLNYLGMHRDITEVHRLEYQVRNQKALIESVVDAAPMVIALLDVDDRVVLDNHEYKKLQADLGMAEPAPMLMSAVRASLELESGRGRRTSGYLFLDREVRLDPARAAAAALVLLFRQPGSRGRHLRRCLPRRTGARLPAAGGEGDHQPARSRKRSASPRCRR